MKNSQNHFYEDLNECIKKNVFSCHDTEINKSTSEKHDIIVLIFNSEFKLNKKSKEKKRKEKLKKTEKLF